GATPPSARGSRPAAPAKAPPTFTRRSKSGSAAPTPPAAEPRPKAAAPVPPPDDVPLPPEPFDPYDAAPAREPAPPTAAEEREMMDEASRPVPESERIDPDDAALNLLRSELGARPLE
ncbi:MAG: DNA polymerase III subunit gamma/tau, partial [Mycobacteriaceae bacterium]|nr:DNA polymerase III subunit gamma/tau [Mycobacteriaceae bacterium]